MCCTDPADDEKARLTFDSGLNFHYIRVLPKLLRRLEVDPMLLKIGSALVIVELELLHEYKLYLFGSLSKIVEHEGIAAVGGVS